MPENMIASSYQRQELDGRRLQFTVTPASKTDAAHFARNPLTLAALCGLIVFIVAIAWFGFIVSLALAIGAGWAARRALERKVGRQAPLSAKQVFTVGPAGIEVPGIQTVIASAEVQELLWRDWSSGGDSAGACALYVETRQGESVILATGMDEPTVKRLADDVARSLGTTVQGGKPDQIGDKPADASATTAVADDPARAAAEQRLVELRRRFEKDVVTSEIRPMQIGDLVLTEVRPGAYEIHRVTDSGREFAESVPADGLAEVIELARTRAGDKALWLEKLAGKGGPAVLISTDQ